VGLSVCLSTYICVCVCVHVCVCVCVCVWRYDCDYACARLHKDGIVRQQEDGIVQHFSKKCKSQLQSHFLFLRIE